MAGGGASKNSNGPTRVRKRVEVESATAASLKRAKDGSAFARCEECNKDVPIALINFHSCSLDAKIKMNLEAQVVENASETKKPASKSKEKLTEPKAKRERKAKNPNAPKRPPTAFFVFMDEFRQTFKAANPDCKSVSTVAKEGGEKWKSMTDEEKKPYQDKAAELKAAYEKALKQSITDAENANDEDELSEKEVKEEVEVVEEVKEETEVVDEVKEEVEVDEE
ncbi:high mobility group B protein 7-like [Nicotiana tabacum]|uniref:High mobility group B protein 7-like n=1 Tax=Nicotiana tabacum TaxID=4097 RepID=A0A1S4A572_TOBAC|nr:PREDICTED: high mobility group B protein 7-like [Nicotiana tabacum]